MAKRIIIEIGADAMLGVIRLDLTVDILVVTQLATSQKITTIHFINSSNRKCNPCAKPNTQTPSKVLIMFCTATLAVMMWIMMDRIAHDNVESHTTCPMSQEI